MNKIKQLCFSAKKRRHKRMYDKVMRIKMHYEGQERGFWKVFNVTLEGKTQTPYLQVVCKCGKIRNKGYTVKQWINLSRWSSCGCVMEQMKTNKELAKQYINDTQPNIKYHGMKGTSLYTSFRKMHHRCYVSTEYSYKSYGSKGITVCDEWYKNFHAFKEWALDNGWKEGYQIDRINPRGNYEPSNCRWLPPLINKKLSAKHRSPLITIGETTRRLIDWKRILKVSHKTYNYRIGKGWTPEQALIVPPYSRTPTPPNLKHLIERAESKGTRKVPRKSKGKNNVTKTSH